MADHDGFRYGQASLLACALGHPADAFGDLYASLPPTLKVPRLPAPPYHFISRVASVSEPPGGMRAGVTVETDYDISAGASVKAEVANRETTQLGGAAEFRLRF